jgi:hypothetical protein
VPGLLLIAQSFQFFVPLTDRMLGILPRVTTPTRGTLCSVQAVQQFKLAFDTVVERSREPKKKDVDISSPVRRSHGLH